MIKRTLHAALTAIFASAFSIPQIAVAQSDQGDELDIEEVIVTARFREESLQDIGASIAAYDGSVIDRSGMLEVQDLALRTVGLEVLDLGPNINDVNIRGITNALPVGRGLKALSTTFLDDVAVSGLGSGAAIDFNMFDYNRVEILRGPQPTYFGEGSVGGTVRYFSNDPSLEGGFTGLARAGISTTRSGGTGWSADAAVTIPLSENVAALRLVGFYSDNDGFIDLPNVGIKDANDYEHKGGRAILLVEPNEQFTARFTAHIDRGAFGENNQIDPSQDLSNGVSTSQLINPATSPAENDGGFDLYATKLSYDFGNMTLESVTGYFKRDLFGSEESIANTVGFKLFLEGAFGVTGLDTRVFSVSDQQEKTFSQEFRLISDFDSRVNFTAGAYYKDSKVDNLTTLTSEGLSVIVVPPTPDLFLSDQTDKTEQLSGFVELNVDVTERFRLIGGVRYVKEDFNTKINEQVLIQLAQFLGFNPDTGLPQWAMGSDLELLASLGLPDNFDFELREWLPRFGAEFDINDDTLGYFNYARGLRNGGLNQVVSAAFLAFNPADGSFDNEVFRNALEFDPDTVDTFELGIKSRLNEGRTTLNAAVFYSDYKDPQVLIGVPTASIENAPDEEIWGVEVESSFVINDNWTAYANVAWLDAEFTDSMRLTNVPGVPPDFEDLKKGNRPTNTPEWTFSVGGDFDYPLSNGLTLFGHGSFSYVDERYGAVQNFPVSLMGSMEILNLRLGLRGERWALTAYGSNILNDLEVQATLAPSNGAFVDGNGVLDANLSQAFVNRPTTWGLLLDFWF